MVGFECDSYAFEGFWLDVSHSWGEGKVGESGPVEAYDTVFRVVGERERDLTTHTNWDVAEMEVVVLCSCVCVCVCECVLV